MKAEFIQSAGDDLTVVNAARVSFDKQSHWTVNDIDNWDGKSLCLTERDSKLIKYLARHGHFTPFTHCSITLRETVPIFVARQRFKHTVGFSYNEVSRRYVSDDPTFYVPDGWRKASPDKKQGSLDEYVSNDNFGMAFWTIGENTVGHAYGRFLEHAEELYKNMLEHGIAPEQARMVLPQSTYTSYWATGSLAAWARAYNLRSGAHAQKEIQTLASQWKDIIEPLFPVSWKALTEINNEVTSSSS